MSTPRQSGSTMQEPPLFTTTVTQSYLLREFPTGSVSTERLFSEISRSKIRLPLKSVVVQNDEKIVVCTFDGPQLYEDDVVILDSIVQRHEGAEDKMPKAKPLTTGFALLDRAMVGGMSRKSVFLLTAPNGEGKTNFAINMGVAQARDNLRVVYACTEETYPQIYKRVAACVSGIPLSMLDAPTPDVKRKVKLSMQKVEKSNFKITGIDISNVNEIVEAMLVVPGGIDVLIIDSIGLLKDGRKDEPVTIRIPKVLRSLKIAASKGNFAVVAVLPEKRKREPVDKEVVEPVDTWLRIKRRAGTLTRHSVTLEKNRYGKPGIEFLAYIDGSRVRTALNTGKWIAQSIQAEPRT
jgi:KaiC/GvpD/RAD55 family RecA-like ATPase